MGSKQQVRPEAALRFFEVQVERPCVQYATVIVSAETEDDAASRAIRIMHAQDGDYLIEASDPTEVDPSDGGVRLKPGEKAEEFGDACEGDDISVTVIRECVPPNLSLKALGRYVEERFPFLRVEIGKGYCNTDTRVAGTRFIRRGKGRTGTLFTVFRRKTNERVFQHNAAETYRRNSEVERWIQDEAPKLAPKTRAKRK